MKHAILFIFTVAFSAVTFGQNVNVSGNWTLNATLSNLNEQFSLAPQSCIINQTDSVLTIEKKLDMMGQQTTITENFNLDGSESTNPGIMESVKKSKVTLSEDKKSIKVTSLVTANEIGEISVIEQYTVENEKLIYQTTSSSSSFGEMTETAVYNKN